MVGPTDVPGPSSRFYISQRLRLHYVDWGNESKRTLLMIHGGRDHCRNWDWVARTLRDEWHVIGPDLRGHGDSAWAIGGTYTLSDFVLDIAQLLEAVDDFPVTIVSHSLGGAVALNYAGTYPENVAKLVAIEGLGPPPELLKRVAGVPGWQRMQNWIDQMRRFAARQPRRYASIEAAMERMRKANPFLSKEQAHHLTIHGVMRNEDGTFTWKFDNYVRAIGPYRFGGEDTEEIYARITCPVLLVRGTESSATDPTRDGRIEPFPDARIADIKGAGHWVHHDRLEPFMNVLQDFLKARETP